MFNLAKLTNWGTTLQPCRYSLFPVQLLFTVTDTVALLLRFCDALPEVRLAIHGCHLLFLLAVESEALKLGTSWEVVSFPDDPCMVYLPTFAP